MFFFDRYESAWLPQWSTTQPQRAHGMSSHSQPKPMPSQTEERKTRPRCRWQTGSGFRFVVRPSGFEPLAFRLGGGCSILLSYGRMRWEIPAGRTSRRADTHSILLVFGASVNEKGLPQCGSPEIFFRDHGRTRSRITFSKWATSSMTERSTFVPRSTMV